MTRAYVLIKSDLGSEEKIIEALNEFEQVLQVEEIFGDYDLIVKLEAENSIAIREVISWDIKKIKGVSATKTLMKKEQE